MEKEHKIFNISIVLLFIYFIYRIIDQSKLMSYFPLDPINDISSYMAQLHFLDVCGFQQFCPYWYNGFITFLQSPPGWYFFAFPLLKIFNSVEIAAFVSIILLYIIAFLIINYYGKWFKFTKPQIYGLFIFFFANAIAIGNHLRRGRPPELLAWVGFLIVAFIALYYKDRKIDRKFYPLAIGYAITILSYPPIGILASVVIFSLIITKKDIREITKIVTTSIIGIILTSFWSLPFIIGTIKSSVINKSPTELYESLYLSTNSYNIYTFIALTIVPIILFITFYFYRKHSEKNITFFYPILIINFLILTRLIIFIPILNNMIEDVYLMFLLLFILFTLFSVIEKVKIKRIIYISILLITIINIIISSTHTRFFITPDSKDAESVKELLEQTKGKFILDHLLLYENNLNEAAIHSYAPIYYNLTTAEGWYPHMKSQEYLDKLTAIRVSYECSDFNKYTEELKVEYYIATGMKYRFVSSCGWQEVNQSGIFHLLKN